MLSAVKPKYRVRQDLEKSENEKKDLCGQSPLADTEILKKLRKRLISYEISRFYWSEWGDSNSRHLEPKGASFNYSKLLYSV